MLFVVKLGLGIMYSNSIFVVVIICIIMIEQVATRACLIFPSAWAQVSMKTDWYIVIFCVNFFLWHC